MERAEIIKPFLTPKNARILNDHFARWLPATKPNKVLVVKTGHVSGVL